MTLETVPILIQAIGSPKLRFWYWYITAPTSSGWAYVGGNVKIDVNGEAWSLIEPEGGYPYQAVGSCRGITGEQYFAGTRNNWAEAVFDLSVFLGDTVKFRFHFGSDPYTIPTPGWYIDDVLVIGGEIRHRRRGGYP